MIFTSVIKSLLFTFLLVIFGLVKVNAEEAYPLNMTKDEFRDDISQRYNQMKGMFSVELNNEIVDRVHAYLYNQKTWTSAMVGRSYVYFPIFDQALKKFNLPTELKYIAVLESSLVQKAKSRAGAVGVWQFMKSTAVLYGLQVNEGVDQRNDIYASSEAAAKYLHTLYSIYGSWELSLMAYNAGPGRVNRAIKAANSDDYNEVVKHLPQETQRYIGKFQAVKFLMEYYEEYGIDPVYPPIDLQLLDTVKVYNEVGFSKLAAKLDYHLETLLDLNPMYQKGYIPTNKNGYNLILPKRLKYTLKDQDFINNYYAEANTNYKKSSFYGVSRDQFLMMLDSISLSDYYLLTHKVRMDESLKSISSSYKVHPELIRAWNNVGSGQLELGQVLTIYVPKAFYAQQIFMEAPDYLATRDCFRSYERIAYVKLDEFRMAIGDFNKKFETHIVQRGETLTDVCQRYKLDIEVVMNLNGLKDDDAIIPGMKLILSETT